MLRNENRDSDYTPCRTMSTENDKNNTENTSVYKSSRLESLDKVWLPAEQSLADYSVVRNLLSQFPPQVSNDILAVEKGMENFMLFNESHMALFEQDNLEHIPVEAIEPLSNRKVFSRFQFFTINEMGDLTIKNILIRPASLRGDLISRAKNACIRGSAIALIKYIIHRNAFFRDLDLQGKLKDVITSRLKNSPDLNPGDSLDQHLSMENLHNLSFDFLLEMEHRPNLQLLQSVLHYLSCDAALILEDLKSNSDLVDDIAGFLRAQKENPVLLRLAPDFHIPLPALEGLIEATNTDSREVRSEMEWVYLIFVKTARKIILTQFPEDKTQWIEKEGTSQDKKYLDELIRYPFLVKNEDGPDFFIEAFERLIQEVRIYSSIRSRLVLELIVSETLKALNGLFEPYHFDTNSLKIPDSLQKRFRSKTDLYPKILKRIKENPEVLISEKKSQENSDSAYLLYTYNLPRAFIRNKNIRSMLHSMAKKSGYDNGVYNFLVKVSESTHPASIINEQLDFAKAIREWEEDIEKQNEKKRKKQQSILDRLVNVIANIIESLFKVQQPGKPQKTKKGTPEKEETTTDEFEGPRRTGVIIGPKEKRAPLPTKVLKAADYVERNNHGLIWLDRVVNTLASVKYNENIVGDYLFYDKQARYVEIKSMVNVRRVYVRLENHDNETWRKSLIEYLENVSSPGPETLALLSYYRTIS